MFKNLFSKKSPAEPAPGENQPQLFDQACQLKSSNLLDQAKLAFNRIITADPDHSDSTYQLGLIAEQQGDIFAAFTLINKAISLSGDNASYHRGLGDLFFLKLRDFRKAIAHYLKVIALGELSKEIYIDLGTAYQNIGEYDKAIAAFERSIAIDNKFPLSFYNLGICYRNLGKRDKAIAAFKTALEIKPDYAKCYHTLVRTQDDPELDQTSEKMINLLEKDGTSGLDKGHILFGLGHIYETKRDYVKSFECYADANQKFREVIRYSSETKRRYALAIKQAFSPESMADTTRGIDLARLPLLTPIFIVGMPRSGSSLIEQIIASHSQVHGAGEIKYLANAIHRPYPESGYRQFPEDADKLSADQLRQMSEDYLEMAGIEVPAGRQFFTDKLPHNFFFIGMIRKILPNAKIINCQRDPVDTCFSCFKNIFMQGQEFSYDLEELAEYYLIYDDLMTYWRANLPGSFLDVRYDEMITEQESQTRKILDYCGLAWEDACLDFHKSARAVATASATQVRKPIYKSSVKLWKNYEKELESLVRVLKEGGVEIS